jgi:hypothetical protein
VPEDFARLIRLSEEQGWRLIVTEMGIDTRTPMGKAIAHMAVVFAELERASSEAVRGRRWPYVETTESSSAGQDQRQMTWWPASCASARRARRRTPLPAISTRTPCPQRRVRPPGRKLAADVEEDREAARTGYASAAQSAGVTGGSCRPTSFTRLPSASISKSPAAS